MSKKKSTTTRKPAPQIDMFPESPQFDFETIHLILSLINREQLLLRNQKQYHPHTVDEKYNGTVTKAGKLMAKIVHPDAVDQFLELFPDLHYHFGLDLDQIKPYQEKRDAKIAQHFRGNLPKETQEEFELKHGNDL